MIDSDFTIIEVYAYDTIGNVIGLGTAFIRSTPNYDQFAIPITYNVGFLAAEMSIIIQIADTNAGSLFHAGSFFIIDDLSFQTITTRTNSLDNTVPFLIIPNPASCNIKISDLFKTGITFFCTQG